MAFSYGILRAPTRSETQRTTAAAGIRQQIANNPPGDPIQVIAPPTDNHRTSQQSNPPKPDLAKQVLGKCADGDIRAALRLMTSDDTFSTYSADTIQALQTKHPPAPSDLDMPVEPANMASLALSVDTDSVLAAVRAMPSGSGAGLDGMRPIFFQQMLSREASESGRRLLHALTRLVNLILAGRIPHFIRSTIFGASLCALRKKDGGIRPIAVGSFYRRLAGRIAAKHASTQTSEALRPVQLGVGVAQGCEAALHACREYISQSLRDTSCDKVLIKVDMRNAFNTIRRDKMLLQVADRCPEVLPVVRSAYVTPTPLYFGGECVMSATGVQQGDPLGSLAFALTVDPVIRAVTSELNVWYLDDGTFAGPVGVVVDNLRILESNLRSIGLQLNHSKCEVAYLGSQFSQHHSNAIAAVRGVLPGITEVPIGELTLLGSPLGDNGLEPALDAASSKVQTFCSRLESLDAHTALFFLVHYASAPRLSYVLRTAPMYKCSGTLRRIDDMVRRALVSTTNVNIEGQSWTQASLPARFGGLGVRAISSLALPCFVASLKSSLPLARTICPQLADGDPDTLVSAIGQFVDKFGTTDIPTGDESLLQRSWDEVASRVGFQGLLGSSNQVHRARLLAASAPNSGAWLQIVPLPSLGLLMDAQTVRTSVALRLGEPICEPHPCRCGSRVDRLGHHGLSCRYSAGRLPRHANLNDVVKHGPAVAVKSTVSATMGYHAGTALAAFPITPTLMTW